MTHRIHELPPTGFDGGGFASELESVQSGSRQSSLFAEFAALGRVQFSGSATRLYGQAQSGRDRRSARSSGFVGGQQTTRTVAVLHLTTHVRSRLYGHTLSS